ncbi:hypothetical protein B0H14DRAFT_2565562 [Mycena olivaceomarginata]|nr:hypothetical protein B0H14DRAFT_2565562 [Mycena olivaceomarginata]
MHARIRGNGGAGVNENVYGRGSVVQAEGTQCNEEEEKSKRKRKMGAVHCEIGRWKEKTETARDGSVYKKCMRETKTKKGKKLGGTLRARVRGDPSVEGHGSASIRGAGSNRRLGENLHPRVGEGRYAGCACACSAMRANRKLPLATFHGAGAPRALGGSPPVHAARRTRGRRRHGPTCWDPDQRHARCGHRAARIRPPPNPLARPSSASPLWGGGAVRQCSSMCAHGAPVAGQRPRAQHRVSSSIALSVRSFGSTDRTPPPRSEHPPLHLHRRTRERRRRGRPKFSSGYARRLARGRGGAPSARPAQALERRDQMRSRATRCGIPSTPRDRARSLESCAGPHEHERLGHANDLDEGAEHGLRIAVPFVANESEILLGVHRWYSRRGTREPGVSARARKEEGAREKAARIRATQCRQSAALTTTKVVLHRTADVTSRCQYLVISQVLVRSFSVVFWI